MRNLVIIDGSNFYHKAKKIAPNIHLTNYNYRKLAEMITNSEANDIEYCVGEIKHRVSGDSKIQQLYAGQQALFYTLQKQDIAVKKGFMLKTQGIFHEKGVDVRMATDIVRGALKNEYDTCYLITSDSDILPAVEAAKEVNKEVVYVAFEGAVVSKALEANCSDRFFITKKMIENCAM